MMRLLSAYNKFHCSSSIFQKAVEDSRVSSHLFEYSHYDYEMENELVGKNKKIKYGALKREDHGEKRYDFIWTYDVHVGDMRGYVLYQNQVPLQYERYCAKEYGIDNDLVDAREPSVTYVGGYIHDPKLLQYFHYKRCRK